MVSFTLTPQRSQCHFLKVENGGNGVENTLWYRTIVERDVTLVTARVSICLLRCFCLEIIASRCFYMTVFFPLEVRMDV